MRVRSSDKALELNTIHSSPTPTICPFSGEVYTIRLLFLLAARRVSIQVYVRWYISSDDMPGMLNSLVNTTFPLTSGTAPDRYLASLFCADTIVAVPVLKRRQPEINRICVAFFISVSLQMVINGCNITKKESKISFCVPSVLNEFLRVGDKAM